MIIKAAPPQRGIFLDLFEKIKTRINTAASMVSVKSSVMPL
jgi:hypothetical protein